MLSKHCITPPIAKSLASAQVLAQVRKYADAQVRKCTLTQVREFMRKCVSA